MCTTPYLFGQIYGFGTLKLGLCYIPIGFGCVFAPLITGRLIDWFFQRVASQFGIIVDRKRAQSMVNFPLERARLMIAFSMVILSTMALLSDGWVMQVNGPLTVVLVLQFFIALSTTGLMQIAAILVVEYRKLQFQIFLLF